MFGVAVFLIPVYLVLYSIRWFRSRPVNSPYAKTLGAAALLVFAAGLVGLLPWNFKWMGAIPAEGLLGRIVADGLIHYFNIVGAYLVCVAVIAVALYLSTAFSFGAIEIWSQTRFAFAYAALDRFADWKAERARKRAAKELEKKRANAANAKPVVTAQIVPRRANEQAAPAVAAGVPIPPAPQVPPGTPVRSGIERMFQGEERASTGRPSVPSPAQTTSPVPAEDEPSEPEHIAVTSRADSVPHGKTTMPRVAGGYKLPSTALLHRPDEHSAINEEDLKHLAQVLQEKCAEFDVRGQVTQINPGPVVTTFEFKPEAGIKYSRVTGLSDDLCLALRAESILIERMSGKSTVGIQVPNHQRETIWLREVVEAREFLVPKSKLTLAMGKDINGRIVTAELNTMPHLLIAGSTGSGKSVAINAFIMSVLYKATPEEVRLILVDPKRLELGNYEGIPHLHTPIITEPKLASNALRNAVREMERRLKVLAEKGVRNIDQYNKLFDDNTLSLFEDGSEARPLPYIVIIIDELADLMMLDGQNVEASITRLAQMARAVGIHLVLATQRPSVDVITGLIKANFPARMSFRVATKIDSRTILDANGAEALLGRGDMLVPAQRFGAGAPPTRAICYGERDRGCRRVLEVAGSCAVPGALPGGSSRRWRRFVRGIGRRGRRRGKRRALPGRGAHRVGVRQGIDFPAAAPLAHRLWARGAPHRPDGARRHRRGRRRSEAARSAKASRLAQRSRRRNAVVSPIDRTKLVNHRPVL